MESKVLTDTSILIDLQRGNHAVIENFQRYAHRVVLSRITACELIYGSENRKELRINSDFVNQFPVIEINETISANAYNLIFQFNLSARLGIADALIAATAINEELPLWTENNKHFTRIKPLQIFLP